MSQKITGKDILRLDEYRFGPMKVRGKAKKASEPASKITVTVSLAAKEHIGTLRKEGFEILHSRGAVAVVSLPVEHLDRLCKLDCVTRISIGRKAESTTDRQRETTGLTSMLEDLPDGVEVPLTGKGVITGLFDSGFDFNHVNFMDTEGNCRIKQMWRYKGEDGKFQKYSAKLLTKLGFDTEADTHGTHVLGIMAGHYDGEVEYAYLPDAEAQQAFYTTGANPFSGVAAESDILVSCGQLYMPNILSGVDNIVSYAQDKGMPAVVNLSLGMQQGAHDGLDPESQFLAELGKEAIIVVASGNDGMKENVISHRHSGEGDEVRALLIGSDASGYDDIDGNIDIWGSSDEGFEVDMVIFDLATKKISRTIPLECNTEGRGIYLTTSDLGDSYGGWHDTSFDHFFEGSYVAYASGVHEENGRFNLYVQYGLTHARQNTTSKLIGFVVRGPEGSSSDIYCYSDNSRIGSKGMTGWSDATSFGTINDIACADNVLVVGSYNNRRSYGSLSGRVTWLDASKGMGPEGEASGFSSYGNRLDGESLPHVCAPGSGVVSSYSRPYVDFYKISAGFMSARSVDTESEHYWSVESGTSMAAPFVSGVIALWLQVCPELTIDQVKEIIAATSIRDEHVEAAEGEESARWGAGKINPAGGLDYILHNIQSSVSELQPDVSGIYIVASEGGYDVMAAEGTPLTATVCDMSGRIISEIRGEDGKVKFPTSGLPSGVYVLTARSPKGMESIKILVN